MSCVDSIGGIKYILVMDTNNNWIFLNEEYITSQRVEKLKRLIEHISVKKVL